MAMTDAQLRAQRKYREKSYDYIGLEVQKGKKEQYKEAAGFLGLGFMEMIRAAIEEFIENHTEGEFLVKGEKATEPKERLTMTQQRILKQFEQLPDDTQEVFKRLLANVTKIAEGKEAV